MSVPSKITPFAYDTNYPAGADPWSGTATKKVTATRNTGFKPKTKIPAQVVNYEINVAQTANEGVRKALVMSALQMGVSIPESSLYSVALDAVANVFWSGLGGLIATVDVNNRVYRAHGPGTVATVTASGNATFDAQLYQAEDAEEFCTASNTYTVVISATGGAIEYDVGANNALIVLASGVGRSRGRVFRRKGSDGYWLARRVTAGNAVEVYEMPTVGGTLSALAVDAALTWPDGTYVSMDWDPTSGERWLSADKVGLLSGSTYTLADTGIGAGYVSRGLTWCESDGVFYCITDEGTSTVLYKRAPGAASWTEVCTMAQTVPGAGTMYTPDVFYPEGLEEVGGVLVTLGGTSLASKGLYASADGGFTWTRVSTVSTSGASNRWRFKRRVDGAIAVFPIGTSITNTANPVVWYSAPMGSAEGRIIGV